MNNLFLCDEIALPEIWKSDVRKVEIILCEFTHVMFCLSRKPHALNVMFGINACDVDAIGVMSNGSTPFLLILLDVIAELGIHERFFTVCTAILHVFCPQDFFTDSVTE